MAQFEAQLVFQGFPGGLDIEAAPGELGLQKARALRNVFIDKQGRIRHLGGREVFVATSEGDIESFIRFSRYSLPTYNENDGTFVSAGELQRHFLFAVFSGSSVSIKEFEEPGGVINTLGTIGIDHRDVGFVNAGQYVLIYGYDNAVYQWAEGSGFVTAGQSAPIDMLAHFASYIAPEGRLNDTNLEPYSYVYAIEDEYGDLSNPSDISPSIAGDTGGPFAGEDFAVALGFDTFANIGLTAGMRIHVYRIGGSNTMFRECLVFTPGSSLGHGIIADGEVIDVATLETPRDLLSDGELPDIFPNFANDPPPLGIRTMILHQNRIFAAGIPTGTAGDVLSPSFLWFSRPGQYVSFGYDDNGTDDDGGYVIIDNDHEDEILSLVSTGSVLILGRKKSIYSVYGDGFTTFAFDKRGSVGVAGRKAMCRCGNRVRYLGRDGVPYEVGDVESTPIGPSIESAFQNVTAEILERAVCFYADLRFYACLPTDSYGITALCLDDRNGSWTDVSDARFRCNHALYIPGHSNGVPELLLSRTVEEGGIWRMTTPPPATDRIDLNIQSDRLFFAGDDMTGRLMDVMVTGYVSHDPALSPLVLNLKMGGTDTDFEPYEVEYNYQLTAGTAVGPGVIYRVTRLQRDLVGEWLQWRISGKWYDGYIDRVVLSFVKQRAARH